MPAGPTFTTIGEFRLTTPVVGVTFQNIPSSYTDLQIMIRTKLDTTTLPGGATDPLVTFRGGGLALRFNNDTGSNYEYGRDFAGSGFRKWGDGDVGTDAQGNLVYYGPSNFNWFACRVDIARYANTTTFKHFQAHGYGAKEWAQSTNNIGGTWKSTAAITKVTVMSGQYTIPFAVGSTITLYGIAAA